MPNTKPEALPRVGCDQLHVAKMLTDTKEGATYDESVHFQNVKSVGFQPGSSISTFYADDGPRVNYAQVGEEAVSFERADLLPDHRSGLHQRAGTGRQSHAAAGGRHVAQPEIQRRISLSASAENNLFRAGHYQSNQGEHCFFPDPVGVREKCAPCV